MRCVVWIGLLNLMTSVTTASDEIQDFIGKHCVHCHDSDDSSPLNLATLKQQWDHGETRLRWIKVFDRVQAGEMPPADEPSPPIQQRNAVLHLLEEQLHQSSLKQQQIQGRVPFRRLSNTEFRYSVVDLLRIDDQIQLSVPPESHSESFDTVGTEQRLSHLHLEGYLKTAEAAVDRALQLGVNPTQQHDFDFRNNVFLQALHELPVAQGGSISLPHDDGVIVFLDVDYLLRATNFGFFPPAAGNYRISAKASAWESKGVLTAKLIRRRPSGAAELVGAVDVTSDEVTEFQFTAWLEPGDDFYLTFEMGTQRDAVVRALVEAEGAQDYKGPGLLIQAQSVEGPLNESWPSPSTVHVLQEFHPALTSEGSIQLNPTETPAIEIRRLLHRMVEQAYRRPVDSSEVEPFQQLATAALASTDDPVVAVKRSLPALLASPDFLIESGAAGPLNDWQLADRLARFLWKSVPDQTLRKLATEGQLSDSKTLRRQVDRMLTDDRNRRFVDDFVNQWLRVAYVDATSPDRKLFPEFDELLKTSIPQEPRLFFAELIKTNRPARSLIDSDFTFVNRRLAEHYGIEGVTGQHFRRIDLPADSLRGGILTQAAVLKTTANGTVTSPVVRGNFVLTNLLGTPVPPPPAGVESIDPDTRGARNIRETLLAHRADAACAKCHDRLDPPGFALEEFDAIGGQRTSYPAADQPSLTPVDPSGLTDDGQTFSGIREYKQWLMKHEIVVARNLLRQLVVYSTGGEIQFADRRIIEDILTRLQPTGYRVKDMIHEVVQSSLFRNR